MSIIKANTITDKAGTGSPEFPNGMKGLLYAPDGSVANPGNSFDTERTSGIYKIATNRFGQSIGGVKVGEWNSNGLQFLDNVLIFVDEKAVNVAGGDFNSGDWRKRDIAESVNRILGASIVSSQITNLPAGRYRISVSCPAYDVRSHQCRVRNITGGTTLLVGSSEFASDASDVANSSVILNREFVLLATSTIEIQHRCEQTKTINGFGFASNFGETTIYTQGMLQRLS